jgi:hypothetical protein
MRTRIIVFENDDLTRKSIVSELEKRSDFAVMAGCEMKTLNPDNIKGLESGIVVLSIAGNEYEASKQYINFLIDDPSVRFLSLDKYAERFLVAAFIGTSPTEREAIASIDDIMALSRELSEAEPGRVQNGAGKYILKGTLL